MDKDKGKKLCKDYKVSAYFFDFPSGIKGSYNPAEGMVLPMLISDFCFRYTLILLNGRLQFKCGVDEGVDSLVNFLTQQL